MFSTAKRQRAIGMAGVCLLAQVAAGAFAAPALAQQQPAAPAPAAPVAPAPVAAATPAAPQPLKLEPNAVLVLVRQTLVALDQANKTGNYSVLRDLGAPDFQHENTTAKLAEIFAGQRSAGLDLGGVVILAPTISLQPQMEKNGLVHMAGFFPLNTDGRLNFELLYQLIDKKLQLYGLSVTVGQAGTAPNGPAAEPIPAPVAQAPLPAAQPVPAAGDPAPSSQTPVKPKPKQKPKPKAPAPEATPQQ